ncbi:hypothetical protein ABZ917_36450 [Nonomuraea wenchangensis]
MTKDLQEIKAFHDALPGPSATATAKAKYLLAAETTAGHTPHAGVARRRMLLRTGTFGLAASATAVAFMIGTGGGATPASAAELLQEAATVAADTVDPVHQRQPQHQPVRRGLGEVDRRLPQSQPGHGPPGQLRVDCR